MHRDTVHKDGKYKTSMSPFLASIVPIQTTKTASKSTTASSTKTTTKSSTSPTCTAGTERSFLLRASGSGTTDNGQYVLQPNTGGSDVVTFGPQSAATPFLINEAGQLVDLSCEIANIDAGAPDETVFFTSAADIATNNYVAAACNIASGTLQCVDQTTNCFLCVRMR